MYSDESSKTYDLPTLSMRMLRPAIVGARARGRQVVRKC